MTRSKAHVIAAAIQLSHCKWSSIDGYTALCPSIAIRHFATTTRSFPFESNSRTFEHQNLTNVLRITAKWNPPWPYSPDQDISPRRRLTNHDVTLMCTPKHNLKMALASRHTSRPRKDASGIHSPRKTTMDCAFLQSTHENKNRQNVYVNVYVERASAASRQGQPQEVQNLRIFPETSCIQQSIYKIKSVPRRLFLTMQLYMQCQLPLRIESECFDFARHNET